MNNIDLLILDGPPAAGKSSLARAVAAELRTLNIPHAIIEMDELARVYPLSNLNIMYKNLAAIWPNYAALGDIKVIIPTYMQIGERELVMNAAPAKRTTICEVEVPYEESMRRIAEREPDEAVRQRLTAYLDNYPANKTADEYTDFKVANHNRPVEIAAQEIIKKMGWLPIT